MDKEQAFIKLESKCTVDLNTHVYLRDAAEVYCKNASIQKYLEGLKIYDGRDREVSDSVSAIDITKKIMEGKDNIDVVMLGEPDVLIKIINSKTNVLLDYIKVTMLCIILFLGTAFTIINFQEDVNMDETMEKIYYFLTGNHNENPLMLLIPYSLGTGLGMAVFFSRIISHSKRKKDEPGAMEVEMHLYEKDIDDYVLEDIKNKK